MINNLNVINFNIIKFKISFKNLLKITDYVFNARFQNRSKKCKYIINSTINFVFSYKKCCIAK